MEFDYTKPRPLGPHELADKIGDTFWLMGNLGNTGIRKNPRNGPFMVIKEGRLDSKLVELETGEVHDIEEEFEFEVCELHIKFGRSPHRGV